MTSSPENPYAGQGAVLLDIGGEVGALVVTMPAGTEGLEVEIRPAEGAPAHRVHQHGHTHEPGHSHHPHVAVVNRPVEGGQVPSLVFPQLVEGRYELYEKQTDDARLTVDVRGGEVTASNWPA